MSEIQGSVEERGAGVVCVGVRLQPDSSLHVASSALEEVEHRENLLPLGYHFPLDPPYIFGS